MEFFQKKIFKKRSRMAVNKWRFFLNNRVVRFFRIYLEHLGSLGFAHKKAKNTKWPSFDKTFFFLFQLLSKIYVISWIYAFVIIKSEFFFWEKNLADVEDSINFYFIELTRIFSRVRK